MARAHLTCLLDINITVSGGSRAITRFLPGGELYGKHPYGLRTEDELLRHIAYNAVYNRVWDVNELEGWRDLPAGEVLIDVENQDMRRFDIHERLGLNDAGNAG